MLRDDSRQILSLLAGHPIKEISCLIIMHCILKTTLISDICVSVSLDTKHVFCETFAVQLGASFLYIKCVNLLQY